MPKGHYERKKGIKKPAVTFKDNFWSRKRVEANVTMNEIADLLGINVKTASAYFTGQLIPHEEQIKTLCDFFDVDVIEGTREFVNAHKTYEGERKRIMKASAKPKTKTTPITETSVFEPVPTKETISADSLTAGTMPAEECKDCCIEPEKDYTPVIKLLYNSGKVDFETYNEFIDHLMLEGEEEAKKFIFDHVCYELFIKILEEFEKNE